MKRLIIIVVLLGILVAGGALSALIVSSPGGVSDLLPGIKIQVADPEASVFTATSWQAQQLFLLVGFLLFNLIGIGVTIAVIMWFLSRQVTSVKNSGNNETGSEIETT